MVIIISNGNLVIISNGNLVIKYNRNSNSNSINHFIRPKIHLKNYKMVSNIHLHTSNENQ